MKINEKMGGYQYAGISRKILMIMKFTTFIMLISLLQVSAATKAQIILKESRISVQKLMDKISVQSGYDFIYSDKDLKDLKPINVDLKNVSVHDALQICFANQPLVYQIMDKTVMIRKKSDIFYNDLFVFIDIRGTVLDEKGQPLSGASIKVKNSKKGVTTNSNGEFQLTGISEGTVLQISFLGYKTQNITIDQARSIIIKMELGTSDLQEITVVNTGYQTLSKERATGSFNTIGKEQLEKPSTNIAQRLIGTTAGMAGNSRCRWKSKI